MALVRRRARTRTAAGHSARSAAQDDGICVARARVGANTRASDKGCPRRAAGRRRIRDSNMAAATSVVVLDRGNNTTCTINLHGVCACACVCGCVRVCMYMRVRCMCGCTCPRANPRRSAIENRDRMKAPESLYEFFARRGFTQSRCRCRVLIARSTKLYVRLYVRACFV